MNFSTFGGEDFIIKFLANVLFTSSLTNVPKNKGIISQVCGHLTWTEFVFLSSVLGWFINFAFHRTSSYFVGCPKLRVSKDMKPENGNFSEFALHYFIAGNKCFDSLDHLRQIPRSYIFRSSVKSSRVFLRSMPIETKHRTAQILIGCWNTRKSSNFTVFSQSNSPLTTWYQNWSFEENSCVPSRKLEWLLTYKNWMEFSLINQWKGCPSRVRSVLGERISFWAEITFIFRSKTRGGGTWLWKWRGCVANRSTPCTLSHKKLPKSIPCCIKIVPKSIVSW